MSKDFATGWGQNVSAFTTGGLGPFVVGQNGLSGTAEGATVELSIRGVKSCATRDASRFRTLAVGKERRQGNGAVITELFGIFDF